MGSMENRSRVQDVSASHTSPREALSGVSCEDAIEKVKRCEPIYSTANIVMVLPCIEWALALDLASAKPRNR